MYAIQHIRTGRFVCGTDYRYSPPHQRVSDKQMLTYDLLAYAKSDFNRRSCSPRYFRIVRLMPVKVAQVIYLDSENGYELQDGDWEE